MIGDFNDIMQPEEKVGRVPHPKWLRRGFCEVESSGLGDFVFLGIN